MQQLTEAVASAAWLKDTLLAFFPRNPDVCLGHPLAQRFLALASWCRSISFSRAKVGPKSR